MKKMTINVDYEEIDRIVSLELRNAYELNVKVDKDEGGFAIQEDRDFLYCLERVIEYFTSPNEYEEWLHEIYKSRTNNEEQ